jgi:hypothetical protein
MNLINPNSDTNGGFISVDPLADKYPVPGCSKRASVAQRVWQATAIPVQRSRIGSWGPYVYCMNNPLLYWDPTGEEWEDPAERDELLAIIDEREAELFEERERLVESNGSQGDIEDIDAQLGYMKTARSDVDAIDVDENKYRMSYHAGEKPGVYLNKSGVISIDGDPYGGISFHEIRHVGQALANGGSPSFNDDGWMINSGSGGKKISNEIDAFSAQYSFDRSSLPVPVNSIKELQSQNGVCWLSELKDDDGTPSYPYALPFCRMNQEIISNKKKLP